MIDKCYVHPATELPQKKSERLLTMDHERLTAVLLRELNRAGRQVGDDVNFLFRGQAIIASIESLRRDMDQDGYSQLIAHLSIHEVTSYWEFLFDGGRNSKSDIQAKPLRAITHLVDLSVQMLPFASRNRYVDEFFSELTEIAEHGGKVAQISYGVRVILRIPPLRRAILNGSGVATKVKYVAGGSFLAGFAALIQLSTTSFVALAAVIGIAFLATLSGIAWVLFDATRTERLISLLEVIRKLVRKQN